MTYPQSEKIFCLCNDLLTRNLAINLCTHSIQNMPIVFMTLIYLSKLPKPKPTNFYLSSHLQCIIVLIRQLKNPYFVSKPIIQKGHDLSCCRQHRSAFENPPKSVYLLADHPLPHHFVPGTLSRFDKSLRCLQLSFLF